MNILKKIAFSNALISIKSMSNFSTSYFNCICSAKNKITRVNFFTISLDIAILLISNNFLPSRRGRSPPLYIKTTSKAFVSKKARCIVKVQFCTSTVPSSNSKQFMLRLMKAFCLQLDQDSSHIIGVSNYILGKKCFLLANSCFLKQIKIINFFVVHLLVNLFQKHCPSINSSLVIKLCSWLLPMSFSLTLVQYKRLVKCMHYHKCFLA